VVSPATSLSFGESSLHLCSCCAEFHYYAARSVVEPCGRSGFRCPTNGGHGASHIIRCADMMVQSTEVRDSAWRRCRTEDSVSVLESWKVHAMCRMLRRLLCFECRYKILLVIFFRYFSPLIPTTCYSHYGTTCAERCRFVCNVLSMLLHWRA